MNYHFSLCKILFLVLDSLKISSSSLTAESRFVWGVFPRTSFFYSMEGKVPKPGMCSLMERLCPAFTVPQEWGWGAFLLAGEVSPLAEHRTHALSLHYLVLHPNFLLPHPLISTARFQLYPSFLPVKIYFYGV